VGPGLVAGYRRARRTMARAYEARDAVAFHEWRTAVKAHRHHVYVLEEIWPEEIDVRLHELEHLGELLGEEHDLAMLHETIRAQRDCFAHERDYRRLRLLVDKRRQRLRAEARPLGERLFAERPRDLRRRFRTYFRTSRRRDTDDARAARATREARDATAPAAPDGGHAAATPGPAQGAGGGTATRSSTRTVTTALAGAPPPV
jgi:hypothetical protein